MKSVNIEVQECEDAGDSHNRYYFILECIFLQQCWEYCYFAFSSNLLLVILEIALHEKNTSCTNTRESTIKFYLTALRG